MARINVDVIDSGCSLRRFNISARVQRSLLQQGVTPSESYVRDFASVREWLDKRGAENASQSHLVLLHASVREVGWEQVVATVGKERETRREPNWLLITYSGSSGGRYCAGGFAERDTDWWHHFPDVKGVDDYYPDNVHAAMTVGLAAPPMDDVVRSLLSRLTMVRAASNVRGAGASCGDAADLRHALVNAVVPLREAAAFALGADLELKEFDTLWGRLKERIAGCQASLPAWVYRSLRAIDATVVGGVEDGVTRTGALQTLVLELGRIEAYARDIGRPQTDWKNVASALREGWGDTPARLLWIDDEAGWYLALNPLFQLCGVTVEFVRDPVAWLRGEPDLSEFDAILLDIILEGLGSGIADIVTAANVAVESSINDSNAGQAILQLLSKNSLCPPVFMLSARESASVITACTKYGASDYLIKGETDYTRFLLSLRREVQIRRERLQQLVSPSNPNLVLSGTDDPLNATLLRVHQISSSGSSGPVLLFGEPGVGKEEIAREFHLRSLRRNRPFVIADCSALSPTLIESELFGHVKGSFTGATHDKVGRFEEADGGTLLIDEIDKIEVALQNKLLRATEARTIRRVGARADKEVDVLLILASNIDPRRAASEGKLSQQLVSRQTFTLPLPPLRARAGAVSLLASGLCARICQSLGWPVRGLSRDAVEWLSNQAATGFFDGEAGNVRGLRNLIEAALVYNPSEAILTKHHFMTVGEAKRDEWLPVGRSDAFTEAGKIVAEFVGNLDKTTLKWIEERFRAALFTELRGRMSRDELREKFDMTPAGLRQHLQVLRDKGLLREGI